MPMLINGAWDEDADHSTIVDGEYVRPNSKLQDWITADGASGFKAEAGRYHLYVAHWCPWAHRTSVFRKLKGLEDVISISIASSARKEQGWMFVHDEEGCTPDTENGKTFLHEIYSLADPALSGRPTVPVLWDKKRQTIVSNESADIIRMFNSAFVDVVPDTVDYYPTELRVEIDQINAVVYDAVNDGVYRIGFATSQDAYEAGLSRLFATLDDLEARLDTNRFLCGDRITEADWRLFSTLIRFDAVYYTPFQCSRKHIYEYHNLSNYVRELYQHPGIADVTRIDHVRTGYYTCLQSIHPNQIIAAMPDAVDHTGPHDRARLPAVELKN